MTKLSVKLIFPHHSLKLILLESENRMKLSLIKIAVHLSIFFHIDAVNHGVPSKCVNRYVQQLISLVNIMQMHEMIFKSAFIAIQRLNTYLILYMI